MNRYFILFAIFLFSCKSKVKDIDLIVIREASSVGYRVRFYVGYDSTKVHLELKENDFILDAVDSLYIYIISKKAFDHLKEITIDNNENPLANYSEKEITLIQPKVIELKAYNKKLAITKYCVRPQCNLPFNEFSNMVSLDNDTTARLLLGKLKWHYFFKETQSTN